MLETVLISILYLIGFRRTLLLTQMLLKGQITVANLDLIIIENYITWFVGLM